MHFLCTICSDLMNQGDNIYGIKCGHVFHHLCLAKWIERSQSCPQCRNKVTSQCMFRVYLTISNEQQGQDIATLQSRLDDANLQLRQKNISSKETEDKLASLALELNKKVEALKATERKLVSSDSAVAALKEQLEYVREENKVIEQLRADNEALKQNLQTLNSLQKVLNATSEDVEHMMKSYTDLRTVAIFATSLKRALCDSEKKKNECRDRLTRTKIQLNMEKKNCADWQAKYLQLVENQLSIERKYGAVKNTRMESELSDKNAFLDDSHESASKSHCPDAERLFNDAVIIDDGNSSLNKMVNRIENAESPYLNLKQSSLALASLQRTSTMDEDSPYVNLKQRSLALASLPRTSTIDEDSPYVNLKQSSLAVASLKRTSTLDGELKSPEFGMLNSARSAVKKMGKEMKPSTSQQNDASIFHKKETVKMDIADDKDPNAEHNISYNGLGGHSKLETFPVSSKTSTWKPKSSVPKLTAKHKLKRPELAGNQDINKMLKKKRDK